MRALVLGSGEMGAIAIRDLYLYGAFDWIRVASRNLASARRVLSRLKGRKTKLSAVRLDVGDARSLVVLMKESDVVINCVGPNYKYELPIARAAIRARVNLVDLNDDYETTLKMYELDAKAKRAGIAILLGMGASPGINNILARAGAGELEEVEEIHTAWVMSAADPGGLALSYHLLNSLSDKALTFQDGALTEVRSFVDGRERMEFPGPVGTIDVFHVGHPEPITLARTFPGIRYADDKASFNPPLINDLIKNLGRLVRTSGEYVNIGRTRVEPAAFAASYLLRECRALKGIPKAGGLRVEVKGRRAGRPLAIRYSGSGRITEGTGIPASIGAQMLVQGKIQGVGVMAPESCVDPHEFLEEILSRGIGELRIERSES